MMMMCVKAFVRVCVCVLRQAAFLTRDALLSLVYNNVANNDLVNSPFFPFLIWIFDFVDGNFGLLKLRCETQTHTDQQRTMQQVSEGSWQAAKAAGEEEEGNEEGLDDCPGVRGVDGDDELWNGEINASVTWLHLRQITAAK